MVDRTYEEWKAREADHRRQRRRRSRQSASKAKYVWDATGVRIKYADLIPVWQHAVAKYVRLVGTGKTFEEAWAIAAPGLYARHHLPGYIKGALLEIVDALS